jgi:hypothetical protein
LSATGNKSWAILESLILVAIVIGIVVVLSIDSGEKAPAEPGAGGEASDAQAADATNQGGKEVNYLPFKETSSGLPISGAWRGDPEAVDLNHDGHIDIITSLRIRKDAETGEEARPDPKKPGGFKRENPPESGLYVFLGDGQGRWTESIEGITKGLGYGGVESGDFNNDGHPDLAFATHRGAITVFLGDGKGNWTPSNEGLDNPTVIHDVTVADFTGDGALDIVALSMFPDQGGGIYCFKNKGDATWTRMHEEPLLGNGAFGCDLCTKDIDKDGDVDFLATTDQGLKVFLNDGKGNFEDWSTGLPKPAIGNSLTRLDAGDIDGDGDLEIVVGAFHSDNQPGLEIYEQVDPKENSGLMWKRLYVGAYPGDFTFGVALGDMDNDNDLDLVTSSFNHEFGSRLTIYANDGTGQLTELGRIEGGSGRATIELADFNNDGRLDVLTVFSAGKGAVKVFIQFDQI